MYHFISVVVEKKTLNGGVSCEAKLGIIGTKSRLGNTDNKLHKYLHKAHSTMKIQNS